MEQSIFKIYPQLIKKTEIYNGDLAKLETIYIVLYSKNSITISKNRFERYIFSELI